MLQKESRQDIVASKAASKDSEFATLESKAGSDLRSDALREIHIAGGPHLDKREQIRWMVGEAVNAIKTGGAVNDTIRQMMGSNRNANPYGASSEAERCLNDTGIQFTRMSRADMNTAAAMFNQQVGRMKFPAGEVQVTPGNFVHFPGGYPHASVGSDNRIDVQFTKGPNGSGGRVKLERF